MSLRKQTLELFIILKLIFITDYLMVCDQAYRQIKTINLVFLFVRIRQIETLLLFSQMQ